MGHSGGIHHTGVAPVSIKKNEQNKTEKKHSRISSHGPDLV